jgi:hypothetical protein
MVCYCYAACSICMWCWCRQGARAGAEWLCFFCLHACQRATHATCQLVCTSNVAGGNWCVGAGDAATASKHVGRQLLANMLAWLHTIIIIVMLAWLHTVITDWWLQCTSHDSSLETHFVCCNKCISVLSQPSWLKVQVVAQPG